MQLTVGNEAYMLFSYDKVSHSVTRASSFGAPTAPATPLTLVAARVTPVT